MQGVPTVFQPLGGSQAAEREFSRGLAEHGVEIIGGRPKEIPDFTDYNRHRFSIEIFPELGDHLLELRGIALKGLP